MRKGNYYSEAPSSKDSLRLIPKNLPLLTILGLPRSSFLLYRSLLPPCIPLLEYKHSTWVGMDSKLFQQTQKQVLISNCVFFCENSNPDIGAHISQSIFEDCAVISTRVGLDMKEHGSGLVMWAIASSSIVFFVIEHDEITFRDEIV